MGSVLQWLVTLRVFSPVLRPITRFLVGAIAVPLFRVFLRRMVREDRLDAELSKDLDQWIRGSVMLLVTTANVEQMLFDRYMIDLGPEYRWLSLGLRLLLAVGIIEAMPDQALFAIIHPGPARLLFPKGQRIKAVKEQWWPFCKGIICRHRDRSSAVFAIVAVIEPGWGGWVCYGLAIVQFLIIGLVSSRDKAIDVLSEFDEQIKLRRQELAGEVAGGKQKAEGSVEAPAQAVPEPAVGNGP